MKGKSATDYVSIGVGFWGALLLLLIAIAFTGLEGRVDARHSDRE
ncbi:MAG: hypothetical protein WEA49_10725 [Acidimicrobiia bacterium]